MLLKVVVIFLWIQNGFAQKEHHDWELAVVTSDQVELLQSNGTTIAEEKRFTQLKALTFDNVRHQFIVSDMDGINDTIFTVQLNKETEITPIIPDLPDDVQGLAIDPIEDILYWTDSLKKTINYVYLNDTEFESKVLFEFSNSSVVPQDIAIDICRRYIYWTNKELYNPTIERAFLNGSNREVLIESDLNHPVGIAIDYRSQRIYWADIREGIYYRIDSANLDGSDREIVYEGVHSKPFGIAVDETSVYWTDTKNNALWRYFKTDKQSVPERIKVFNEEPKGIITKNVQIRSYPDCKVLEMAIEKYGDVPEVLGTEKIIVDDIQEEVIQCLNGAELIGNYCKCKRGFSGRYCETENCRNFCIHGTCHLSSKGYPQCHCPKGFGGNRCELDMCKSFCLNGGECSYSRGDIIPSCTCSEHFTGSRCEISTNFSNLCLMYCKESTTKDDFLVSRSRDLICRCERQGGYIILPNNITASALRSPAPYQHKSFLEKVRTDADFLIMLVSSVTMILIISIMSLYLFLKSRRNHRRPKRPFIRKRIIVNKNVTPLTYRPQQVGGEEHQCEITIENCCNMNICETPCFEPSGFVAIPKDDKKTLLSNMENGEETY